jgi:hypothetical protein
LALDVREGRSAAAGFGADTMLGAAEIIAWCADAAERALLG